MLKLLHSLLLFQVADGGESRLLELGWKAMGWESVNSPDKQYKERK